jgi:hypothetical protein
MNFVVSDDGELPRGLYCYAIVPEGEEVPCNVLQIYAKNKNNSITLSWDAEGGSEFRIYRGRTPGRFDGFFTVYSVENYCLICDNGLGVLNEFRIDL